MANSTNQSDTFFLQKNTAILEDCKLKQGCPTSVSGMHGMPEVHRLRSKSRYPEELGIRMSSRQSKMPCCIPVSRSNLVLYSCGTAWTESHHIPLQWNAKDDI
jgi:hypothetical protein